MIEFVIKIKLKETQMTTKEGQSNVFLGLMQNLNKDLVSAFRDNKTKLTNEIN